MRIHPQFLAILILILMPISAFASPYEGEWKFTVTKMSGSYCTASAGSIIVNGVKIRGVIYTEGLRLRVRGKTKSDGTFSGRIGTGIATFEGSIKSSSSGGGTWKNRWGCKGTFKIYR